MDSVLEYIMLFFLLLNKEDLQTEIVLWDLVFLLLIYKL